MTFAESNPMPLDGNLPDPESIAENAAPAEGTPTEPVVEPSTDIDWSQRVEEWGGQQSVEDAIAIAQALQDEDGVKALVTEGLRHLGATPEQIDAFIKGEQAAPAGEPEDPDRLVTAAEVEKRLAAIQQAQHEAEASRIDSVAQRSVVEAVDALQLADEDEARIVLSYAQKYASPEERDPQILQAAINAGHADYLKKLEEASTRYVERRQELNDGVPTPVTGSGPPGGEEVPAPKNMDEAKAAARRMLRENGDL